MFLGINAPLDIIALRNDVDLMSTFPAEPGRIEPMSRRVGIFELPLEQHISGLLGQRGESLTRARDKLMKFER